MAKTKKARLKKLPARRGGSPDWPGVGRPRGRDTRGACPPPRRPRPRHGSRCRAAPWPAFPSPPAPSRRVMGPRNGPTSNPCTQIVPQGASSQVDPPPPKCSMSSIHSYTRGTTRNIPTLRVAEASAARHTGDQKIFPHPDRPQRTGGEREKQALRVGRVQEEGGGEKREGEYGAPGHPLPPAVQGYAVDEEEGERQKEEGEEGAPDGEGFLGDGTPEELGEGPHQQRVKREEGRGDVLRGAEVPAQRQHHVVLPVPVRPQVHAPRRHVQGHPLEVGGRHDPGEDGARRSR